MQHMADEVERLTKGAVERGPRLQASFTIASLGGRHYFRNAGASVIFSFLALALAFFALLGCSCEAPDTRPPEIRITYPPSGAIMGGTTEIRAEASDDVGVTEVVFFLDGDSSGPYTRPPWNRTWQTWADDRFGDSIQHTVLAKARDAAGNVGLSPVIVVTVFNPNVATPAVPDGPYYGTVGVRCDFSTTARLPYDYQCLVQVRFAWGDSDTADGWNNCLGLSYDTFVDYHTYSRDGTYQVKAQAREGFDGDTSAWSLPHQVVIAYRDER